MQSYAIAGFNVLSEFDFGSAFALERPERGMPDVSVYARRVVEPPEKPFYSDASVVAAKNDLMFRPVPGLVFRVRGGHTIEIQRDPCIADTEVRLFLIGSAWGILCHQRGLVPIHCSAVGWRGRTFAFTGDSGRGKSTLAAALSKRGMHHLCDDVGIIDPADPRKALVPLEKGLKLWGEAADRLEIPRGEAVSAAPELDKYYVSTSDKGASEPQPVTALYVLNESNDDSVSLVEYRGTDRFRAVADSVYRVEWMSVLRNNSEVFGKVADLSGTIPVFGLTRPKSWERFDGVLDVLQTHMGRLADAAAADTDGPA